MRLRSNAPSWQPSCSEEPSTCWKTPRCFKKFVVTSLFLVRLFYCLQTNTYLNSQNKSLMVSSTHQGKCKPAGANEIRPDANKLFLLWTETCRSSRIDDLKKNDGEEETAPLQSWYFTGATAEALKRPSETIIVTHDCPHKSFFTFCQTLGPRPCPFSPGVCHWDFTKLLMNFHEAEYETKYYFWNWKQFGFFRHLQICLSTVLKPV